MLLQRADGLHEGSLKVVTDAHDLSCGLHLCSQRSLGADKFVKWQSGHLYNAVVKHWLEACICLLCDRVLDLVQCVAKSNLGRHLGNGVACGLGGQGGRTAHTGIYLDNAVLKAVRFQGVLHVAASGNVQLADDVQGGGTEHLVLLVPQRLGGRHDDTVSCVHAYRVDIFHITYSNAVAVAIPHYLVLDLFPSRDAALYKHLPHAGETQAVLQDLHKLLPVVGDTAAAAAQRVGRAQDNRVANLLRELDTVLHIFHHERGSHWLADLLHGSLELQTVLRLLNGLGGGSDEAHVVPLQEAVLLQLHGQVQGRLSAQGGKDAVRLLLQDELLYHFHCQRLNVDAVRDILVRHDGGRVGIEKDNLQSLLLQGTACLCSRIVKFCRLTDDDRTGTDNQYFFNIFISRH